MYGLQLVEQSEGALKRGTVYVTLGRMEAKGLVESEQESRSRRGHRTAAPDVSPDRPRRAGATGLDSVRARTRVGAQAMTVNTNSRRRPGTILLKISRLLFNAHVISTIVEPTIADLQREVADARHSRARRWRARWRGYRAFWTLTLVAPFAAWGRPRGAAGAVALPDAIARVAVTAIVLTLLSLAGPALGGWVTVVAAASTLVAVLIQKMGRSPPIADSHSDRPADVVASDQLLLHRSRRQYRRTHLRSRQRVHRRHRRAVRDLVLDCRDRRREHSCLGLERVAHQTSAVRPSGKSNRRRGPGGASRM